MHRTLSHRDGQKTRSQFFWQECQQPGHPQHLLVTTQGQRETHTEWAGKACTGRHRRTISGSAARPATSSTTQNAGAVHARHKDGHTNSPVKATKCGMSAQTQLHHHRLALALVLVGLHPPHCLPPHMHSPSTYCCYIGLRKQLSSSCHRKTN